MLAIPAGPIAEQVAATSKSVNVVLPGALATRLDFSEEVWKEVISKRVPPKTVEANLRAFDAGYGFARKGPNNERSADQRVRRKASRASVPRG